MDSEAELYDFDLTRVHANQHSLRSKRSSYFAGESVPPGFVLTGAGCGSLEGAASLVVTGTALDAAGTGSDTAVTGAVLSAVGTAFSGTACTARHASASPAPNRSSRPGTPRSRAL